MVDLMLRRCADGSRGPAVFLAAATAAVVLAVTGCSQSLHTHAGAMPSARPTYTLMQMNLCLSGLGSCYGKVAYPGGVNEAVARIRETHPDAVTFNEACGRDVTRIARRTGYHARFSRVIYGGKPLPCVKPGGRGLFGDAVLTRSPIKSAHSAPFAAQADIEQRRWLCLTTQADVDVCTAHLATRDAAEVAANGPQCAELRALLARRALAQTVIFGGDLNRHRSCAPEGFWARTDRSAEQHPGLQQVYGTGGLRSPSAAVIPAEHTDHDVLVVRAHLGGPG